MTNLVHDLNRGARVLGIPLCDQVSRQLIDYLLLIEKWNRAFNLTAVRGQQDMLKLHLLDSLAIEPYVCEENRLIDIGTGAGLPGMVLAILKPERQVSLLDTNGKKCRFLNQVVMELGLANVQIIHERVESWSTVPGYPVILSRAFASLKDMTDNAAHLLAGEGRFLAMKGRYPKSELEQLNPRFSVRNTHRIQVPELDAERYLIEIVCQTG